MTPPLSTEFATPKARQSAVATLELRGELDLAVAAQLVAEFDKLLASDPAGVIVDLRELSFMDVFGMRGLIALRTRCEEQGRRLVLVRGQRAVHRLLGLCGVERTFEFVDSVAEARKPTGAGRSLTATATRLRARSAPGFADHRHPTSAPIHGPSAGLG